jgi:hypothetical protein
MVNQLYKIKKMKFYKNQLQGKIFKTTIKHNNFKKKVKKRYSHKVLITKIK